LISISVIIPVYNSSKYIKRCLNSLINQDYSNYEIFIVDDASTDNSLEIIREYALVYKNIKIKSLKKNKGVSNARNCGIKECNNEYIMFCDSDDWYESDALRIISKAAEENHADFVMSNHYISYDRKKIKVNYDEYFKNKQISKKECISYMTLSSCSKLIKKSIFLDNKILFPSNIKRCEELSVIPIVAFYANNPIFIKKHLH
jgi:glycosyltransferase involved in cell wall biosynthesis